MMKTFMDGIRGDRSIYSWRIPGDRQQRNLSELEDRVWRKIFHGFKAISEHPDSNLKQTRFTVHGGVAKDWSALFVGVDERAPKSIIAFFSGLLADVTVPGSPTLVTTPQQELLTPYYRYVGGAVKSYRCDAEDVGKQAADQRYGTDLVTTFYDLADLAALNAPDEYSNED